MKRIYKSMWDWDDIDLPLISELSSQYRHDPKSLLGVDADDAEHITSRITRFLADYPMSCGLKGYVIGMSGGIDSALSAMLAVKAVGKESVYCMLLPSMFTSREHIDDALLVAGQLGIRVNDYKMVQQSFDKAVGLTMLMSELPESHPKYRLLVGNNHARERMKILRGKASSLDRLVLGTTNLTESWLGYATIAGDGYRGVDIEPILQLPKTSERLYARHVGIPERIIAKAPTAGLWEGQTDEGEIGMAYENIDLLMVGLMVHLTVDEIVSINKGAFSKESAEKVLALVERNEFKAKSEPFADLSVGQ